MKTGMIHVYTGDGKGKTTAAIGAAVRARGWDWKVLFAQLFKFETGERKILEQIGVRYIQYSATHPLFKKYTPEELAAEKKKCEIFVNQAFRIARRDNYDMLILDEIGSALSFDMVNRSVMNELIRKKPDRLELILTGRGFPSEIIALADYANDIKMIAHPYNKGVSARKGIEY